MNEQRRVIYSYRREILEGKDMSDDAREQLVEVVSRMVDEYTPGDVLEEWDLGELQTQVRAALALRRSTSPSSRPRPPTART